MIQSSQHSIDIHHNNIVDASAMEELTTKGRLLLGKHYNGPVMLPSMISSAGLQNQHKKKQNNE